MGKNNENLWRNPKVIYKSIMLGKIKEWRKNKRKLESKEERDGFFIKVFESLLCKGKITKNLVDNETKVSIF